MLHKLLPRKTEFFDLFSRHAGLTVEGAKLFAALVGDLAGPGAEAQVERIHATEHEADAICQKTVEKLHGSFITPIERSDIVVIASRIDDVMDHVEAAAQRLQLYEIDRPTPEIGEMAANLVRATEAMKVTVDALAGRRDGERVRALCAAVKQVEKENDRVLRRGLARLFKDEQDTKNLIKWKEIFDEIEAAIDCCEDVSNVVEGVVLENA